MKNVSVLATALSLVATMAAAQTTTADKKMPPPMAKPVGMKGALADKLIANENKLIEAVKAKDAKTFGSLVKAGSWSIDENGFMLVDEFTKALGDPKSGFKIDMLKAMDMQVFEIDANAAIVAYTTEQKGSFMGMAFPPKTYVTTIWANHGGTWHAVFHQESTAAPPPAGKK